MYYIRQVIYIFSLALAFLAFTIILFSLSVKAESIRVDSEPAADDQFEQFLENWLAVTEIHQLHNQNLTKGESLIKPWSGSYWPIHKGILSQRYADPDQNSSQVFIQNYNEFRKRSSEDYLLKNQVERLSPAEKYDLLVGDSNWTLSKKMWEKGLKSFENMGFVTTWTGICHGWAAASHQIETSPHQTVSVIDVTGRYQIPFYASDIKGLISLLWANSSPSTVRAGNRCRGPQIKTDFYLRPTDVSCLDSNPKTWHVTITNRMGINKKSMVMDSSAGPEVWNYPITAYDYHYFDVKTLMPSQQLENVIRRLDSLPINHLSPFRSPHTQFLIGIIMDVYHPSLTEPNILISNKVVMSKKTYVYDLELNSEYQIVGGEWYSRETPDFIWTYPNLNQAYTREDSDLKLANITWDSRNFMLDSIATAAQMASRRGEVLSTLVMELLYRSQLNTY